MCGFRGVWLKGCLREAGVWLLEVFSGGMVGEGSLSCTGRRDEFRGSQVAGLTFPKTDSARIR